MKENVIEPISVELLEAELTPERLLRHTCKAENEIYVVDNTTAPNVIREIGRLREISFRQVGCGTGKACDIDEFDLEDPACKQLVLWNPDDKEIIGGYRFTMWRGASFKENGQPHVATEHIFDFSEEFINTEFKYCLEMGRAFIQPKYQSKQMGRKALYALDNIWDGIGAILAQNPDIKHLCGKVSVFDSLKEESIMAILYFLHTFYGDKSGWLVSKAPVVVTGEYKKRFDELFNADNVRDNYRILATLVHNNGDVIPPLIHSYMELSPTMRIFGTTQDADFGNVFDSAIMINIAEIIPQKWERYVESFHD